MDKKILTIDFDIIMYPVIKLYNDKIAEDLNYLRLWESLEEDFEIDKFVNYDAKLLQDIVDLIKRNVKNHAIFIPVINHEEVIDHLQSQENFEETKYNLTNIDWHHDLGYVEDDYTTTHNFNEYTCANWVYYLHINDKLSEYCWVKAGNSDKPIFQDKIEAINELKNFNSIKNLDDDFEQIYFCLSPHWVPYKYHHLYNIICSFFEDYKI